MGGRLALNTAISHPSLVHSLILESASPGLEDEAERVARILSDEQLAETIERDGLEAFVEYWTTLPLFATQSDDVRAQLKAQRLMSNNPCGLANSLRGMGTGAQSSLWYRLNEVDCPTLLITGKYDDKFTRIAQRMAAKLPEAHVKVIEGAGHTVHAEQAEIYIRTILDFVI
jgi:2-succinyl-6-hydroxy-2,4-cyclohexadiene-1-carboxylate synthase